MFAVDMMKTAIELVNIFKLKNNPINKMMDISASFRDRVRQGLAGDVLALESGDQNMTIVKNKSRIAKAYNNLRKRYLFYYTWGCVRYYGLLYKL